MLVVHQKRSTLIPVAAARPISGASVKLALAAVLLALAAFLGWRFLQDARAPSDAAFFYDLSERKLFVGPRAAIPPIRGCNDDLEDAVRAVVVSTNGNPDDRAAWVISYLEMYSPELKREMETARAEGRSPSMGRGAAQAHRFVRRPDDPQWFPLTSPEAEQVVAAWLTAGPDGGPAVICTP